MILKLEGVAHVEPTIFERVNHSHILIQLDPVEDRKVTQDQVVAALRQEMLAYPGYKPVVLVRGALGGGEQASFPIQVSLLGPELKTLADIAMRIHGVAQKTPSLADAKVTVNISNPEVRVAVDRHRAADLGVRISTVARALRLMVAGEDEISTYREGQEQYPVKMRVREDQRRDMEAHRQADGAVEPRRPGADRQHRHPRTRRRSDHPAAIQSSVLDRSLFGRRSGARARRSVARCCAR